MDVPYFFESVVARKGDSYSLVESSVVHLLLIGLAGLCYYRKHTLLMFSLVISPELNNRRQSLPQLELEDLSSLLTTSDLDITIGLIITRFVRTDSDVPSLPVMSSKMIKWLGLS